MAKWGEGDPRWIVEERPDATNVNNWHWTEKNANQWSIDKIKSLFVDLEIKLSSAQVKLVEVEKCQGEAVINNRKGKLIFFFEWEITIKWTSGSDTQGKIHIPNLSEENDLNEVDVTVTGDSNTPESIHVKEALYSEGRPVIRQKLGEYVSCLKEEFAQGMILPKKDEKKENMCVKPTAGIKKLDALDQVSSNNHTEHSTTTTTSLDFNLTFLCSAADFYNTLTQAELVSVFTHSPALIDAIPGGKFEMFGGNIVGEFIEVEPGRKIVQKWRTKSWKNGHFSIVTIGIDQAADCTKVNFKQTGIPEGEEDATRDNWNCYYWEALKRTFGFGLIL